MSDLISRESLKQRINLNYNNHQYIDIQSIKDIINTEPSVEDKTVEELEKIKEEAEENSFKKYNINNEFKCFAIELPILNSIINDHIEELKGENK